MKLKKCLSIILVAMSLTVTFEGFGIKTAKASENGQYSIEFNSNNYTNKTITVDNKTVKIRAYENIVYVLKHNTFFG